MIKLLLSQMGLGLSRIFGREGKKRVSPHLLERQKFEEDTREQLVELKKKGLSIPVFTL